jgi:site-specific DNA-methyltransferase (adenine-specific)
MTPADLLAEQSGHGTAEPRVLVVLAPWTAAEQQRHREDLAAALGFKLVWPPKPSSWKPVRSHEGRLLPAGNPGPGVQGRRERNEPFQEGARELVPYYDADGITMHVGDCLEVLPALDPVDVVIADPPYNVGKNYTSHDDAMPAEAYIAWLRAVLNACSLLAAEVVFFPGTANLLSVPDMLFGTPLRHVRTLGWHKREFAGDKWMGGPAMCWEPVIWASSAERPQFNRIFGTWGRDFLVINATHGDPFTKLHPCPKPVEVMRWLVGLFCPEGGTVLDPFSGTGATLRAAKDLGRKAVGVELESAYCDAAAIRLGQGVLTAWRHVE